MGEPSAADVRRAAEFLVRELAPAFAAEMMLERALQRLGSDENARRVGARVVLILEGGA